MQLHEAGTGNWAHICFSVMFSGWEGSSGIQFLVCRHLTLKNLRSIISLPWCCLCLLSVLAWLGSSASALANIWETELGFHEAESYAVTTCGACGLQEHSVVPISCGDAGHLSWGEAPEEELHLSHCRARSFQTKENKR